MLKDFDFFPINSWMESYVSEEKFTGCSLLIASGNEIIHKHYSGFRNKKKAQPFDFDTVVRIYSMTKPITSLALMILEDKGKVDLNTPIDDFIPSFSNSYALIDGAKDLSQIKKVSPPTLVHLLTHTSGLSYGFNDSLVGKAYAEKSRISRQEEKISGKSVNSMDLQKLCDAIAEFPLSFAPGRQWEYSMSIDVIGRVIEIVSGKNLSDFITENILEPAEMHDTGFFLNGDMKKRMAECYVKHSEKDSYVHYLDTPDDYEKENVNLFLGGSGLLSTIFDYFKFTKIISNDGMYNKTKILSPHGIQKLTTNMLASDIATIGPKDFAFMSTTGMGHSLGGSVIIDPQENFSSSKGDYSWGGMASTYFWIDRVNKISVIFLTQLIPSGSYPNRPELKKLVRKCLNLN